MELWRNLIVHLKQVDVPLLKIQFERGFCKSAGWEFGHLHGTVKCTHLIDTASKFTVVTSSYGCCILKFSMAKECTSLSTFVFHSCSGKHSLFPAGLDLCFLKFNIQHKVNMRKERRKVSGIWSLLELGRLQCFRGRFWAILPVDALMAGLSTISV